MPVKKLTKEAIEFIVETYDCKTKNYTFPEIADLVASKFGIVVGTTTIHKTYHKNRDNFIKNKASFSEPVLENESKSVLETNNIQSDSETKEQVKPIKRKLNFERKVTQTPKKSGFDETLGQEITKDNLEDYL